MDVFSFYTSKHHIEIFLENKKTPLDLSFFLLLLNEVRLLEL